MNTAVVVMLSNYTHDLATGLMFGSVIAYLIARGVLTRGNEPARVAELHGDLYRRFRPVVLWALAAVLVLGVPRMIYYEDYEWLPAAGRGQVTALVAKHMVLVTVTGWSLFTFFRAGPKAARS